MAQKCTTSMDLNYEEMCIFVKISYIQPMVYGIKSTNFGRTTPNAQ